MALKPPVEVPQGAIRLNTDSQKLEFYAQDQWWQMATDVPTLDGGARGLFAGMTPDAATHTDAIDYITIPTAGNATDFGNLSVSRLGCGGFGSRTRGVFHSGGGGTPTAGVNVIDYVTIASTGNAADFGDSTTTFRYAKGLSNQTRGMNAGGYPVKDTIDYVTIASTGNAIDFGNLTSTVGGGPGGGASPTRGVFSGGYSPNSPTCLNTLQYVTIATTGNAQDFGDMATLRAHNAQATSSTRSIVAMGYKTPSTNQETSEVFTFATLGNSTNFGDTIASGISPGGTSDSIRGVWAGGGTGQVIQYVNISTEGNAVDFGDMITAGGWIGATSNAHGGL